MGGGRGGLGGGRGLRCLRGNALCGNDLCRNALCRNRLRRNTLRGCPRCPRRIRLTWGEAGASPSRRVGDGVRLRRGVIVGRVVQHHVMTAVVGLLELSPGLGLDLSLCLSLGLDVLG